MAMETGLACPGAPRLHPCPMWCYRGFREKTVRSARVRVRCLHAKHCGSVPGSAPAGTNSGYRHHAQEKDCSVQRKEPGRLVHLAAGKQIPGSETRLHRGEPSDPGVVCRVGRTDHQEYLSRLPPDRRMEM